MADVPGLDAPMADVPMLDVPADAPLSDVPTCGNGALDMGEDCDGALMGTGTCMSEGFDGGTLGCRADCSYDVTACTDCGDGMREGAEVCDGADLASRTCMAEGFFAGTLACAADCGSFVTTGCTNCGNGTINAPEACDRTALGGATCMSRGFDGGTLSCTMACAFNESGCTNIPAPAAGEVIVTEIMPDPSTIGDNDGEWFEVLNRSTAPINLEGCTVEDNQTVPATFTITTDVIIAPGGLATFARSAMPGFTPSYVYPSSWALANTTTDRIRIICGGTTIDNVDYTTMFPWSAGTAMQLDPGRATAGTNDAAGDWCAATSTYGAGAMPDRGTPGTANRACFSAEVCTGGMDEDGDGAIDCADTECALDVACRVWTIGFCRLQSPLTITTMVGGASTVFGRVFVAGLTDVNTTGNDPHPRLIAAVGVGPDGSDPSSAAGWTWAAAMPNAGYGTASPGFEANNDEYQASLVAPGPPGMYDYAYRFSGNGGATWTYCDGMAAGSSDGYQTANAGQMTVTPSAMLGGLVINEIDYDMVGAGDAVEFIEIYNGTGAPVPLANLAVVLVNGATNAEYPTMGRFPLSSAGATLPAGGYLVLASATTLGTVPGTALTVTIPGTTNLIQNGAPDGVALIDTVALRVVDALSYEGSITMATITGFPATVSLVEGVALPAADSDTVPGSLCRLPNGTDLNNAATDWAFTSTATIGAPNVP